jgi:hypothetical protein
VSSNPFCHAGDLITGLPGLMLPPIEEPTQEELKRRQRLVERARELREAIRAESGPLTVTTDDLKHESRQQPSNEAG